MKTRIITIVIVIIHLSLWDGMGYLFAQTSWTKEPTNPVLRRDTVISNFPNDLFAISDCWVTKERSTYKMWYTCGGLNYPTDTLLRSRLCFATSVDGSNWIKYSENPILDVSYSGGWDSLGVETATVLIDSLAPLSERYKMWYAGQYFNTYRYDIGYATSADGLRWTKHGNPVLQVGTSADWDNGFLEGPSVIKDGNTYKMWYCGYDAVVDGNGTDGKANIGYATSSDGITWTKSANNPILSTGINSWDAISVQDPHVIKDDNTYLMWYGGNSVDGYGQEVGFATSTDGIIWIKYNGNPVLAKGNTGAWDANTASFPSVLIDDGNYKMWYTGKSIESLPVNSLNYYWEIGLATSMITGLEDVDVDQSDLVTLYPNPARNSIRVQISPYLEIHDVNIYNALGHLEKKIINANSKDLNIELADFESGLFFVIVQTNSKPVCRKFIINK